MLEFVIKIQPKKSNNAVKTACLIARDPVSEIGRFLDWNTDDICFITGLNQLELQQLDCGIYHLEFFDKIAKERQPIASLIAKVNK